MFLLVNSYKDDLKIAVKICLGKRFRATQEHFKVR